MALLLLYFGARLLFLACTVSPAVPPDEVTHFAVSTIFSNVLLFPADSPATYQYGLVTTIPWLYYWVMGKLLPLNIFGIQDLVFLRLLNIPLAFGTVWYAWRTLCLLTDDRLTRLLLVVIMTNTPMFSFLSAAVSYDNLTILLATMSIYYLLAFFRHRSGTMLAASMLCQLAGCLAKSACLPLLLVLNMLLVAAEFRNLGRMPSALMAWWRMSGMRAVSLTAGIVILGLLNLQLYGGNYLRYRSLVPDMDVVLSPEIALQYRTQARNLIFKYFRDGRISKEKALEMAARISSPSDRGSTVALIEEYDHAVRNGEPVIGLPAYIPVWVATMLAGTFGIFAHLPLPVPWLKILMFLGVTALAGIGALMRWRPGEGGRLPLCLMIVAGFYAAFLMYAVNYRTYLEYRSLWLSLQGRYIFPVIGPIAILVSYYLLRLFSGSAARLAVFAVTALLFVLSDFPWFLSCVTPEWFFR
jgi:hypothetical protein